MDRPLSLPGDLDIPPPPDSSATPSAADPTVVGLLSLKLLLLAFFILLTSLADFQEDRTRQVLESVSEAFKGQVQADRSYNLSTAALADLEELEVLFDEVGELIRTSLPAAKVERAADRLLVSFTLPAATLFAPGSTRLRPGRWLLLRRLAEALSARGGLPYAFTVLHGVAPSLPGVAGASPAWDSAPELDPNLARDRLSVLAETLIQRGLPAERFAVGLEPGEPGRVRFLLQLDPAAAEADGEGP